MKVKILINGHFLTIRLFLTNIFRTVKFGNQFGSQLGPVELGSTVAEMYPDKNIDDWQATLQRQNLNDAETVRLVCFLIA